MNRSHDPTDVDWALVGRYFAGELSPDECRDVECWIAAEPGRRAEMVLLRRLWDDAAAVPTPARVDELWRSIARKATSSASAQSHAVSSGPHRHTPRPVVMLPLAPSAPRWTFPAAIAAAAV